MTRIVGPQITAPSQNISAAAEGARILGCGAGEHRSRPAACIPELVAEQAGLDPEAVAAVAGDHHLTYRELDERANRLAHRLRDLGAQPGTAVGVLLPRGIDLVIALLAVGRAGAAALPLAPEHPRKRLAVILADATPAAVITTETLRPMAAALTGVRLVDPADGTMAYPSSSPSVAHHPSDLAYIAYTSGSTGHPKGVEITHEGLRNRVLWAVEEHGLGPQDRVLQRTTISFDAAMWEVFAPLVAGGAVVMAPPGAQGDPAELLRTAAEHGVTVLQFVPSLLAQIVEEPGLEECSALRLVLAAGEPLPTAIANRLVGRTGAELYNTYGPTECSIDATAYQYTGAPVGAQVPIGTPLPNMKALVLTDTGRIAADGEKGELHLGGVGLARGYLGRPGLTADRFVPDAFTAEPGARLYRTGDVVRRDADGFLVYLGRRDGQLKVRGIRIEPGEIEARLRELSGVTDAAVVNRQSPAGEPILTAFLLVRGNDGPGSDKIRAYLGAHLPAAAVPARYVPLDRFPSTGNGKIDRTALTEMPLPEEAGRTPRGRSPEDAEERLVVRAWSEILGLPAGALGVDDDFFALGGHSLSAARVVARLRAARGVELPLVSMFEARTPARLAELLRTAPPAAGHLVRTARGAPIPLSAAQERLWVQEQFDPGSPEYLLPVTLRIRGPLDLKALRAALGALVRRHEILRTRYQADSGGPVQVVDPPTAPTLRTHHTASLEEAVVALRPELDRGFDLAQEHPFRAAVAQAGPAEYLLVLVFHHIAADGWSMDPLARDLAALYQAAADRTEARLDPLSIQYADYAAWHREQLAGLAPDADRDYWHGALAGLPALDMPTDRSRPAIRDIRGAVHTFTLPADTASPLLAVGVSRGATPFMTLLAAFAVLLGRWCDQDDVAVGAPVVGRGRMELDDLIGFFVNTLVLRTSLGQGPSERPPSFVDVVDRVRTAVEAGLAHQQYPVDRLIADLTSERSLSRSPLFSVYFQVHDDERAPFTLANLEVEPFRLGEPSAITDLALAMERRPDGLWSCDLEYATALFDETTMRRLAECFALLLTEAAARPDLPVADLPLPGGARALTAGGNSVEGGGVTDDPAAVHLPGRIGRQAAATPDAPAVISTTATLSYRELDEQANRLAHHLLAADVRHGDVVGVLTGRDPDLVVAWLAVLRTGAVYLPLNPHDPDERLAELVGRAHAGTVLTLSAYARRLAPTGARVVELDREASAIAARPSSAPRIEPHPRDLAYIIHTSGSTGRPKGVMIEHLSYLDHCRHMADAYALRPGSRVAFLAAVTFDGAMDQIAAPLLVGAAVVVLDPRITLPGDLISLLDELRVTLIDVTPPYFRALVACLRPGDTRLARLELMGVGGDAISYRDAQDWLATGLPGRFACTYGPTEATIACTFHPVRHDEARDHAGTELAPLGTALAETTLYTLDPHGHPVPAGSEGELYIGGNRVARGYLDDPRQTAERFLPDPFSAHPGSRMYRTGDRVRCDADSVYHFIGRIDRQVKIRGFRIEPAEVEAALAAHAGTLAAAVVVHELRPGDPGLVGYAVPKPGGDPSTYLSELREHLTRTLPSHMVPARLIVLDALPLTRNGKVDRNALPAPAPVDPGVPTDIEDQIQERIAVIWREVLGLEQVGAHDSFFVLGGHSLLATQVCLRLRETFPVAISLRQFFGSPTVAGLADLVRRENGAAPVPSLGERIPNVPAPQPQEGR
ncbi:Carrier domain-containing protein [Frankia sp. AiPs1]|uniref:non-ribosomal peptide synthetase n=1 Tax=Frankia sp. AiPa1 TaxID=573492 RepID=UPI00202B2E4B|nr:non-ribosomal peptide synthetase [Frankia sp. AiPa1]MCL9758107.1 amino acid adenylation domain-containing protein [Frankia sp. AiPa1]